MSKDKSKCEICWKWFIWACPLFCEIPKNIISCSAYEPTNVYLKEQEIILEFIGFLKRNKRDIIKDVDTIEFIIERLEKEGFQYILDDKKEGGGEK